jgi:hypothetical protein
MDSAVFWAVFIFAIGLLISVGWFASRYFLTDEIRKTKNSVYALLQSETQRIKGTQESLDGINKNIINLSVEVIKITDQANQKIKELNMLCQSIHDLRNEVLISLNKPIVNTVPPKFEPLVSGVWLMSTGGSQVNYD